MSNGKLALIGLLLFVLGSVLAFAGVLPGLTACVLTVPGGWMLGFFGVKCLLGD